jgi:hypothetical protein
MSLFAGQPALGTPEAPLVSGDDFAEWFSLGDGTLASLPQLDQNRVQTALEIASAAIRNNRRIFTSVSNETVEVDGHWSDTLLLPKNRLPVTDVSLVEQLSGADYVTVDPSEYDWSADGYLTRCWSWWTDRPRGVRVTYSHGYDILPRDVAGVCLAAAKRVYDQPDGGGGVQSEQLGDHHVTYLANAGVLLPDDETLLRAYEARA